MNLFSFLGHVDGDSTASSDFSRVYHRRIPAFSNRLTILVALLALLTSTCQGQQPATTTHIFDAISAQQTNQNRCELLEKHDLEKLVKQQFEQGPKYIAIAGISGLECPGADHRRVPKGEMIVAPLTGCTPAETMSMEQHQEWTAIAASFALRWNLLMQHFEMSSSSESKPEISLADVQAAYRIQDDVYNNLSLESKLLMRYSILRIHELRNRASELQELLDANGIFEPLKSPIGK